MEDTAETLALLRRAARGEEDAQDELFLRHRVRLERLAGARLNPRLRARLDPGDVVQSVCMQAWERLPEYLRAPDMPFFLWLRFLTAQRIIALERRHLGAQARDAGREQPRSGTASRATDDSLAEGLARSVRSPSEDAARDELRKHVLAAIEELGAADREVLLLRQAEQLTNAEVAFELGLQESAASRRYLRALQRLAKELRRRGLVLEDLLP